MIALDAKVTPGDNETEIIYQIFDDEILEGTEMFLLSRRNDSEPCDNSSVLQPCSLELQVSIIDDDGELLKF